MGIADSVHLANSIIKNIESGHDFGIELSLNEYENNAKAMNYATVKINL
jgi:hypothetical protein